MSSSTPQLKSVRTQGELTKITLGVECIRELQRYVLRKNGRVLETEKHGQHRELPETAQAGGGEVALPQDTAPRDVGAST